MRTKCSSTAWLVYACRDHFFSITSRIEKDSIMCIRDLLVLIDLLWYASHLRLKFWKDRFRKATENHVRVIREANRRAVFDDRATDALKKDGEETTGRWYTAWPSDEWGWRFARLSVKKWKFNIVNHPDRTFRNALIANNMSLVRCTTLKKIPEHFAVLGFSLSGIRNQSWNTCRQLCCTLGVQIKWGNV